MWQLLLTVLSITLGWLLATVVGLNPAVVPGMGLFLLVLLALIIFFGMGGTAEENVREEEKLLTRLLFLATPLKWLLTLLLFGGAATVFGFEGDWVLWTAAVTSVVQIDPSITVLGTLYNLGRKAQTTLNVWATCDDPLMILAATLFVDSAIVKGFSQSQLFLSLGVLICIALVMLGTYQAQGKRQRQAWTIVSAGALAFSRQPVVAAVLGLLWQPSGWWKVNRPGFAGE